MSAIDDSFSQNISSNYILTIRDILQFANLGLPRSEFLIRISRLLITLSQCDKLEIRISERGKLLRVETASNCEASVEIDLILHGSRNGNNVNLSLNSDSDFEQICRDVSCGVSSSDLPCFTKRGSFYIGDSSEPLELSSQECQWAGGRTIVLNEDFVSVAIVRFQINDLDQGLVILKSDKKKYFSRQHVESLEEIAYMIGIASSHRRLQEALGERVKELTCLYEIASIAAQPDISLRIIATKVLDHIPPGWFYPDITTARITLDGLSYTLPGFTENLQKLSANIVVDNKIYGTVEVAYTKDMPELDEGPFLKEERKLINAIVHELALIIERRQIQEEQKKLHEQLRHADRLATIGQLAAGVAHELNEPLGNILGFAQLTKKGLNNPVQVLRDIEKIESASLHAREVVKKLLVFARETPQKKSKVDLSEIVDEGLYFLESRCAKSGIKLVKKLSTSLPAIMADKSQLYQVLVNLVVNSIQAMTDGGTLIVRTDSTNRGVTLSVKDSGSGIEKELLEKIFIPFFTTKDVNEGTGLGLAVVHGIVTAHGGSIDVESTVKQGTTFTVFIPHDKRYDGKTRPENDNAEI